MPRIYFDTNVFSNLRSNSNPLYQEFNNLIRQYKNNLNIFFSIAHIRDKKKDKTDFKFLDFSFMEELVVDNYLGYDPIEKRSSFYLATPQMVFNDETGEELDFTNLFKPKADDDEFTISYKKTITTILSSIKIPYDNTHIDKLSDKQKASIAHIMPNPNSSLMDFANLLMKLTTDMFSDNTTYKDLRSAIDEGLNSGLITLKNKDGDLNQIFENSSLKKTFVNYVKDSMHYTDKNEIPYYNFYLQSYNTLDMLSVDKDKLTDKNSYSNIFNDGLHSYFARYCDYLISDDKSFKAKTQALYKTYGVNTEILSTEDFIKILPAIGSNTEIDINHFWAKLEYDLQHGGLQEPTILEDGTNLTRVEKHHLYFNFFDMMFVIKNSTYNEIALCKSESNSLSEPSFREEGMILNKIINLFGNDIDSFGYFNLETHRGEERNSDFIRKWDLGKLQLNLSNHKIIDKFSLTIVFPNRNSE